MFGKDDIFSCNIITFWSKNLVKEQINFLLVVNLQCEQKT